MIVIVAEIQKCNRSYYLLFHTGEFEIWSRTEDMSARCYATEHHQLLWVSKLHLKYQHSKICLQKNKFMTYTRPVCYILVNLMKLVWGSPNSCCAVCLLSGPWCSAIILQSHCHLPPCRRLFYCSIFLAERKQI